MESLLVASGLTSLALGAAMTLLAWNVVRENRRREAARVQLLSGLAFPNGMPSDAGRPFEAGEDAFPQGQYLSLLGAEEFLSERPAPPETLFREPATLTAGARRVIALAAVTVVMVIGLGTYKWFAGAHAGAAVAPTGPAPAAAAPAPEARVELLALDHRTTPAGLLVTGRVRNPVAGVSLHDVVAVVNVLDRTGRVLTTARAPIARAVLNAGEWSDFSVAASKATNVARYRVEFHSRERERVPQIDLRNAGPASKSE